MAEATIPVKQDVKDLVDAEKREGETYNGVLKRLLGETDQTEWTAEEIYEIAMQAVQDYNGTNSVEPTGEDFRQAVENADEGSILILDETDSGLERRKMDKKTRALLDEIQNGDVDVDTLRKHVNAGK